VSHSAALEFPTLCQCRITTITLLLFYSFHLSLLVCSSQLSFCFILTEYTRWFKYDRDDLCVNKSQFVPVIFEPPCIFIVLQQPMLGTGTHSIQISRSHTVRHIYNRRGTSEGVTSTKHTTNTKDKPSCPQWVSNPRLKQPSSCITMP
jgi:hypothetical protein